MNIYESYIDLNFLAAKTALGGLNDASGWTPLADKAQREFVSRYYENVMEQNTDKRLPLYGFEMTQRVRDNLRPFITRAVLTPDPLTGQVQIPTDYWHPWGFFCQFAKTTVTETESIDVGLGGKKVFNTIYQNKPVELLASDEYGYRLDSNVQPPALDHPICKFEGTTAFFAPYNTLQPTLTYIRRPKPTVFNFTPDVNGDPVYNPIGSIGWEAPEDCHNELVNIALKYLAAHANADNTMAYARTELKLGS